MVLEMGNTDGRAPDRTDLSNECRHPEPGTSQSRLTPLHRGCIPRPLTSSYTSLAVRWLHKDIRVYFTPSHIFLLSTYTTTLNSLSTYIIKQKLSCLLTPSHGNLPVYLHHHMEIPLSSYPITRKSSCLLTPSHGNPPVYLHHQTEILLSTYTIRIRGDGRADDVAHREGLGDAVLVAHLAEDGAVGVALHADHQVPLHAVVGVGSVIRLDTRLHTVGISVSECLVS